jgi:hypothetical protein
MAGGGQTKEQKRKRRRRGLTYALAKPGSSQSVHGGMRVLYTSTSEFTNGQTEKELTLHWERKEKRRKDFSQPAPFYDLKTGSKKCKVGSGEQL